VAQRLLEINRTFYAQHGHNFSETRQRLQPGVQRLMGTLSADQAVMDLGCGNGGLARALSLRSHRAPYLGVDFSPSLLEAARRDAHAMPARFVLADILQISKLTYPEWASPPNAFPAPLQSPAVQGFASTAGRWPVIAAFAVLHHIPSRNCRLQLLGTVWTWLQPDGRLFMSNWQFLSNQRLRARTQPWSAAGLSAAEVDPNDYLLDWRHGPVGLRYVHQFDEAELRDLATSSGFNIVETFYADGSNRHSGLYQVWMRAPRPAKVLKRNR